MLYNNSRNHEQINLGSKVSLKYLKQIIETQEKHEILLESMIKNQKLDLNKLNQVSSEVISHKPLTAKQVTELVEQIAQQPKLVEAEALRLTANLEVQVQEVKNLAHEIKGYLFS